MAATRRRAVRSAHSHGGDIHLVEGTIGATFRVSIPDPAVDINVRRGERTRVTATDRV